MIEFVQAYRYVGHVRKICVLQRVHRDTFHIIYRYMCVFCVLHSKNIVVLLSDISFLADGFWMT